VPELHHDAPRFGHFVGVAGTHDDETGDGAKARELFDGLVGRAVFADADGKMNLDIRETGGEILAVSQFTLLADTRKGKRPSFVNAALPREAELLFDYFCKKLHAAGVRSVETGSFGAMMDVKLLNYGPITIVLER